MTLCGKSMLRNRRWLTKLNYAQYISGAFAVDSKYGIFEVFLLNQAKQKLFAKRTNSEANKWCNYKKEFKKSTNDTKYARSAKSLNVYF